eukprot:SAG22_NODE_255_length_13562_cov_6.101463_6_plen_455_part_00
MVYNLLKDKELRAMIKKLGLPSQGERDRLEWRHREYCFRYNALCDEGDSISQSQSSKIVKDLVALESDRFRRGAAASSRPHDAQQAAGHLHGTDEDKEAAAAAASAAAELHVKKHADEYDDLIDQILQRRSKRHRASNGGAGDVGADASAASSQRPHKKQRYTFDIDAWADAEEAKEAANTGRHTACSSEPVCSGQQFRLTGCGGVSIGASALQSKLVYVVVGPDRIQLATGARDDGPPGAGDPLRAGASATSVIWSTPFAGNRLSWESTAGGLNLWYRGGSASGIDEERSLLLECSPDCATRVEEAVVASMQSSAQLAQPPLTAPAVPAATSDQDSAASVAAAGTSSAADTSSPAPVAAVDSGPTISDDQLRDVCIRTFSSSLCGRPGCDFRQQHYHCTRNVMVAGSKCSYKTEDRAKAFMHGRGHVMHERSREAAREARDASRGAARLDQTR